MTRDNTVRTLPQRRITDRIEPDDLRSLVTDNADGILVLDGRRVVVFANPAARCIFGAGDTPLLGERLELDISPTRPLEIDRPSLDGEGIRSYELRARQTRWTDEPALLVSVRDITERRRASDEIELLNQLVRRAGTTSSEAADGLQDFIATVAHELRTPLTSILGAARTLQRTDIELDDHTRRLLVDATCDQAERLRRIVEDVLDARRIDADDISIEIASIDPLQAAGDAIRSIEIDPHAGIELLLEADQAPPRLATDPHKLHQVLTNLLQNSVKYSPEGGTVRMRVGIANDMVRFVVSDEGLGIPAESCAHVFDKFYRVDAVHNRGIPGTGLGLYVSGELVRRLGGLITVDSTVGSGSTFCVELPATS